MAGKNQVTLTFAGDADKLSKTFSEVEKKSTDLGKTVKQSSKTIGDSKDSFDKAGEGAKNTYDKFDSLESVGRGTTDTMSGLANIMAGNVLQGSTDLAGGVAALADGFEGALLPGLKKAIGGIQGAAKAMKAFTLSLLTNPIFLVVAALALLGIGLKIAYDHSEKFRDGVNAVWNNIKAVVLPILKAVWDAVVQTFEGWLHTIEKVIKVIPGGNALLKKMGENAKGVGDAMADTGPAAEDWEHAQKRLNDQVDNANKTLQTQLDLLDKWYGETKDAAQAAIDYAGAVDDSAQSLKDNGKTVDIHTEKGRNNRKSLLDLADANHDLVGAMRKNGDQSDKLVAQNETGRKKFEALATSMGMSKGEAKKLADQLFKIPETRTTTVTANTKTAKSNVDKLLTSIKLLPNYKTIEIKYTTSGVNVTTPSSVGRAVGGPVTANTPYMVGERGPEMWVPNANGSIVPNHKLGSAGGDTYVTVEIDGQQLQARIDSTVRGNNRNLKRTVKAG